MGPTFGATKPTAQRRAGPYAKAPREEARASVGRSFVGQVGPLEPSLRFKSRSRRNRAVQEETRGQNVGPSSAGSTTIAEDLSHRDDIINHMDYLFDPTTDEVSETIQLEGDNLIPQGFPAGTYLRNGPNSRYGAGKEHFFDGDGMIHGVTIDERSSFTYFNQWIRTRGFKRENIAKEKLYDGVLVNDGWKMLSAVVKNILWNGETSGAKDTANTNVVHHAGRTLALMEAQKPVLMELKDHGIETVSTGFDFDGALMHNVTAHPKVCPKSGDLVGFSYNMATKPHLYYFEVDASGKLRREIAVENLDRGIMTHDMAITESYAVLLDVPITFKASRIFLEGEFPVQYERESYNRIGLIRRGSTEEGSGEVRWFDVKGRGAWNMFHTVNAYEDASTGEVVLHGLRSRPEKSGYIFNDYAPSYLSEFRVDPKSGDVLEKQLGTVGCEFPCINPNFLGSKARYTYVLVDGVLAPLRKWVYPPIGVVYTSIIKYDLSTGEVAGRWDAGYGLYIHEPAFVPREGAEGEDDGFVVALATDAENQESYFVILDAANVSEGPVCMLKLPQKVAHGLHGCFVPKQKQ